MILEIFITIKNKKEIKRNKKIHKENERFFSHNRL